MKAIINEKNISFHLSSSELPVPSADVIRRMGYYSKPVYDVIRRELKRDYKEFLDYARDIGFLLKGESQTDFNAVNPKALYDNWAAIENIPVRFFSFHTNMFPDEKEERWEGGMWHGEIISARRKELKMLQPDLARMCGISTTSVSLIENGKIFNPLSIKKICEVLDIEFKFPNQVKFFER